MFGFNKTKIMKKTLLISALAITFFSCKKEEIINEGFGNSITYTIICDSCTAFIDTRNGLNEKIEVIGIYQRGEINKLKTINITTVGYGKISSNLKSNNKILHNKINIQNGNAITYSIKVN